MEYDGRSQKRQALSYGVGDIDHNTLTIQDWIEALFQIWFVGAGAAGLGFLTYYKLRCTDVFILRRIYQTVIIALCVLITLCCFGLVIVLGFLLFLNAEKLTGYY